MREARLYWFGYVQRRKDVKGIRSRKAQDSWLDCVKPDMVEVQLTTRDANDRNKWKNSCSTADPATMWDKRWEEV
ncbi:hypothetical protein ANCCAN_28498 [Ancylostoma caninum]|uniref:Uncharacterized protein n=1 Tax=Ancylostoma caninum TaxID=29170 RepID=A0A368F6H2_ANCCA|nr:hypothetical protein ANCCAN_28498 [Ancylostoma caninum]